MFLPISELGAQAEEKTSRWSPGNMQPKESVVFNTRLPQIFTRSVTEHVETQQAVISLSLEENCFSSISNTIENIYNNYTIT